MRCTTCGRQNDEDARFCVHCGAALRPESTQPLEEVVPPYGDLDVHAPPGGPRLIVRNGQLAGSVFSVTGEIHMIGRAPQSDVFLDDVTVSRRHAEIRREGGTYVLRDEGSLNGTYVNAERLDGSHTLRDRDVIQVGRYRLLFRAGDAG